MPVRRVRLREFQGLFSGMQEISLGMADQEREACVCNGEQEFKLTISSALSASPPTSYNPCA